MLCPAGRHPVRQPCERSWERGFYAEHMRSEEETAHRPRVRSVKHPAKEALVQLLSSGSSAAAPASPHFAEKQRQYISQLSAAPRQDVPSAPGQWPRAATVSSSMSMSSSVSRSESDSSSEDRRCYSRSGREEGGATAASSESDEKPALACPQPVFEQTKLQQQKRFLSQLFTCPPPSRAPSCSSCKRSKVKCAGGFPCARCDRLNLECVPNDPKAKKANDPCSTQESREAT